MAGHVASLTRTTELNEAVSESSGSSSFALLVSPSQWACGRAYHQGSAGSPGQLAQAESLSFQRSTWRVGLHFASEANPPKTIHKILLSQLSQHKLFLNVILRCNKLCYKDQLGQVPCENTALSMISSSYLS